MPQEQTVVWETSGARIVCLNSFGHVDAGNSCHDVLVCGTHGATCGVELAVHTRPRGIVCHAAGPGLDDAGVSGLPLLDQAGIPAAAVDGASAPIGDGLAIYQRGRVLRLNASARTLGVEEGIAVMEAALLMATRTVSASLGAHTTYELLDDQRGRIIGLDSVVHGDERMHGAVLCLGSHSGFGLADYLEGHEVRGTIANDAGQPLEDSAVAGFARLQERGIPAAVVDSGSARMGDARSTYQTGVISLVNNVARANGVTEGMKASAAAELMLTAVPISGGDDVEPSGSVSAVE